MVAFPSGGWDQWLWKSLAQFSPKSSLVYMVQTHVTSVVAVHIRWFSLDGRISQTAPEPKGAKHRPLNKNYKNQLVKSYFLGNIPRKQQKRGVP